MESLFGGGLMGRMKKKDPDAHQQDRSETVHISPLALLKMLKHGREGVPVEVMGLMLGEFVDEYTVNVVDVFPMPQTGTGVSVESHDEAFQQQMIEMLHQTGRAENAVGWYHSHPGFGCWLSSIDLAMQESFERTGTRCVAVVVDPIQSVRGKVVIDAFRCMDDRQTTSNVGLTAAPNVAAITHGLNRNFYSLAVDFVCTPLDIRILTNLDKKQWAAAVAGKGAAEHAKDTDAAVREMKVLAETYGRSLETESTDRAQRELDLVGKVDPKRRLSEKTDELLADSIVHCLDEMIGNMAF